jgi:PhnB protein
MKDLEDLYKKVVEHKDIKITMPLDEQYWGGKMGCFIDKYGISWMLHSQPYSKLDMD